MLDYFFDHIFVPIGVGVLVVLGVAWFGKLANVVDIPGWLLVLATICLAPFGVFAALVWALSQSGL